MSASTTTTTTTNENANNTQKPPSSSSSPEQTMCQKYNIRTHIITSQSDITSSSTNTSFAELYNMFLDDVNNTLKVIGVDVEWGVTETPALIQISSTRVCFVIVVARDPTLLEPFRGVLADKTVVKAGVSIRTDKKKIGMIKYDVHGEVDLAAIMCRTPEANDVQSLSLARITAYYCGHILNKDLAIVCSNWESEALSREQLEYAADDAVAGLMSFEAIMKKHINAGTNKTAVAAPTAEPDSTLLAPTTPSAYYSSSPTATTTTSTENTTSPATTTASPTSSAFSQSSPTTATTARVNRTPIEWSNKYIERKPIRMQPKNNNSNSSSNNQSQPNAAAASPIEQQDSSAGVIARFQSQMERRYQTVSQTQDSLERVAASGVQAVGPDDTNLFCLDLAKATSYVRKGIAQALEYDDDQKNEQGEKILKKIRLTFTPKKKTELCRTWHINNGFCPNATCPFAHGAEDFEESIQVETRELEESITAQQLAKAGLRSRCDMCRGQNARIKSLAVVPSPLLRLMGSEIADETGCSVGLHMCCKCQESMFEVFVSVGPHLRQQAAKYFVGNDLHFGNGSTSGVDGDNASSKEIRPKKYEQKHKTHPKPEITLMANMCSFTSASMTKMCSLCTLIAEKERLTTIPIFHLKEITFRINVFYETLVREGIMMEKSEHVKPLSSSSFSCSSPASAASTTSPSNTSSNIDDNPFIKAFMKESEEHRQLELERAERYREEMLKKKREQETTTQSSSFGGGDASEKEKEKGNGKANKKSKEDKDKASSSTKKKGNTSTTAEQQALLDSDPYFKEAFERAQQIADRINQFSKSDWLSSAEARDIARYFCLRPVDERERAADIVTKEEEHHFITNGMKQKLVEDQSLNRLRVCEVEFAKFWAKRMFEYYRTVFEQQLRPVVIPWKSYCRNPKQQTNQQQQEQEKDTTEEETKK